MTLAEPSGLRLSRTSRMGQGSQGQQSDFDRVCLSSFPHASRRQTESKAPTPHPPEPSGSPRQAPLCQQVANLLPSKATQGRGLRGRGWGGVTAEKRAAARSRPRAPGPPPSLGNTGQRRWILATLSAVVSAAPRVTRASLTQTDAVSPSTEAPALTQPGDGWGAPPTQFRAFQLHPQPRPGPRLYSAALATDAQRGESKCFPPL